MACFLVPTTEAIVTTIIKKKSDKKAELTNKERSPFVQKLGRLNNMLWGGSALLAFEHIWHGEVTPWFPFLTNAADPTSASEMLFEMATSGVAMAALVTAVWFGTVVVTNMIGKRSESGKTAEVEG